MKLLHVLNLQDSLRWCFCSRSQTRSETLCRPSLKPFNLFLSQPHFHPELLGLWVKLFWRKEAIHKERKTTMISLSLTMEHTCTIVLFTVRAFFWPSLKYSSRSFSWNPMFSFLLVLSGWNPEMEQDDTWDCNWKSWDVSQRTRKQGVKKPRWNVRKRSRATEKVFA